MLKFRPSNWMRLVKEMLRHLPSDATEIDNVQKYKVGQNYLLIGC